MRAWKRGAVAAARGSVLRVAPPLSINAAEVDELAHSRRFDQRDVRRAVSSSRRRMNVARFAMSRSHLR